MYEEIKTNLSKFIEVEGVMSVIFNSPDGMVMDYVNNGHQADPDITGALSAGIFGMIKSSLNRISKDDRKFEGKINQILIELTDAKIMSIGVTEGIVSVVTTKDVNLGMLRLVAEKVSKAISSIMAGLSE